MLGRLRTCFILHSNNILHNPITLRSRDGFDCWGFVESHLFVQKLWQVHWVKAWNSVSFVLFHWTALFLHYHKKCLLQLQKLLHYGWSGNCFWAQNAVNFLTKVWWMRLAMEEKNFGVLFMKWDEKDEKMWLWIILCIFYVNSLKSFN